MGVPLRQQVRVGAYLAAQKLKRRERPHMRPYGIGHAARQLDQLPVKIERRHRQFLASLEIEVFYG